MQSWKHLIHIHIPKCAGTNFEAPLTVLPEHISNQSNKLKHTHSSTNECNHYIWHGNLGVKIIHDAYIREVFASEELANIQGSFVATHDGKHSIYDQELIKRGFSAKKICLVREPEKRLYSHIRHNGRISKDKQELLHRCVYECNNLIDRYIYDYDLFDGYKESPHCHPSDHTQCNTIDFIDIKDSESIGKIKSSFLTATLMPNIVQYNRINDDKSKNHKNKLQDVDFQEVYKKLISRGFIDRDNQIDLEYLKKKTQHRLRFPGIIYTGEILHPITLIYPKTGKPKILLTQEFVSNPIHSIKNLNFS